MKIPKRFIILKDFDFLEDGSYCKGLAYWSARRGQVFCRPDGIPSVVSSKVVAFFPKPILKINPSRCRVEDFRCGIEYFTLCLTKLVEDGYILILK